MNAQEIASNLVNKNHEWVEAGYFPKLGVCSNKHVWFWFTLIDGELYFDHAYSQINGTTKKDWRTAVRARNFLKK